MNYRINVFEVKNSANNVRAYANVAFGESFVVRNIAIVEKKDGSGYFVAMPSYRSNEVDQDGQPVYKSVANPITKEFQKEITGAILEAYEKRSDLGKEGLKTGDGNAELKYNVAVNIFEKDNAHIRGLARMYMEDTFVVQNISIVEGKKGLFVSMPAYKNSKGEYQDIAFPISKEFRGKLYTAILDTYQQEKEKPREERNRADSKDASKTGREDGLIEAGDKDELPFR